MPSSRICAFRGSSSSGLPRRAALPLLGLALAGAACSSSAPTYLRTAAEPGDEPVRPGLVVAEGDPAERRVALVDARVPRTSIGHFRAGDRVQLRVIEGLWTYAPGAELVGPNGLRDTCRAPAPHVCAAGEDAAPGMGLLLFAKADPRPAACSPSHRFYIPTGVEFAMPQDAFLFLAPNDREDGVFNNTGAVDVVVEAAPDRTAPAFSKQKLAVQANEARTPLGRLSAGVYLRVSVLGGTWSNDPGATRVGSEGNAASKCHGGGEHVCPAGEGRAPIMGLTLLMASCEDGGLPRTIPDAKRMIGAGADVVVETDGELLLGPNDWEDGCHDNSGFMKVEVTALRAGSR
jgi:hypothetical protein